MLIIDTGGRSDIDELVRLHQHVGPGDVRTQWGSVNSLEGDILLQVDFQQPVQLQIILRMPLSEWSAVIDQIVQTQLVYLQPGTLEDTVSTTLDNPKVLMEVPSKEFAPTWEQLLRRYLGKEYSGHGLSRQQLDSAIDLHLRQWRAGLGTRLHPRPNQA